MREAYTKLYIIITLLLGIFGTAAAQQEPMFTQYMFNSLSYNPAYAGSKNYLSANILYRTQWQGWNTRDHGLNPELTTGGAPISQTFTVHTPVGSRIGLGFSVINDKIGTSESTSANVSYAYRFPFTKGHLAIALQIGAFNYRTSSTDLIARNPLEEDPAFSDIQLNLWRPNFGTGLYYNSDRFYLGVSIPRLFQLTLREYKTPATRYIAKAYQHFYFTMGGAIPVKGNLDFVLKPSLLVKSVGLFSELQRQGNSTQIIAAPTEFDLDFSILLRKMFWLGVSFRSSAEIFVIQKSSYDSADVWFGVYLKNGLRLAAAYDFSLTPIQNYSIGSFEMSLGYDFDFSNVEKVNSPRYF